MVQDREREAAEALERVTRDAETVGTSSMARAARRIGGHFAGHDSGDPATDPVELWGRRIGRALSLVAFVALTAWLGLQLGWWRLPGGAP